MTGWLHHIRTEPHKVFNPSPAAWLKASIPTQISIKRTFLTTAQDIKRQVCHPNVIGCPLSCCVHAQHQAHRRMEHYTSAIKWASGQYQVIGPIQTECLIYSDHQSMEADVFTTYVEITAGVNIAALLLYALFDLIFICKRNNAIWLCIKNWFSISDKNDEAERGETQNVWATASPLLQPVSVKVVDNQERLIAVKPTNRHHVKSSGCL